jgi:hypothetical protein
VKLYAPLSFYRTTEICQKNFLAISSLNDIVLALQDSVLSGTWGAGHLYGQNFGGTDKPAVA